MHYLGLDIGSVSVKLVALDKEGSISAQLYLRNQGLIDTVKQAFQKMRKEDNWEVRGVGITGSGKEFVNLLVGGDIVESEIIAHTVAAQHYVPDVRTIFDIGGEDCKLMTLANGTINNFIMNRDCGGGTGAMIESIARRMGIDIEDVGELAMKSNIHLSLPSKCGIFCQSAVVSKLNKGMKKEDILMGVCRGMIGNFLTMLAKGIKLEPPYVFQGATAQNKALVHCFEEELGHKVIVPENCSYMGAIGMALIAKENAAKAGKTNFMGFDIADADFSTKNIISDGCTNMCEICYIYKKGKKIGVMGNRCEKCV